MPTAAPEINNRYRLGAPLGAGAMGLVFAATDRLSGGAVALKQVKLPPELSSADVERVLLALAHEFGTLAGLRHPHIISVLDYGVDARRRPFYTMELLQGSATIRDAGHALPVAARVALLTQALEALAYLHRRGILHHDLKPANLLVADGRLRLLDFGLAVSTRQARADDTFGTLLYLAPEVLDGQPYTEAADLYSIGVIAYELLLGSHPFAGETLEAFLSRLFTAAPDLSPLASEHPALAAVVGQLLAKDPADRPRSAQVAIARLREASGQLAPPADATVSESYLQAASFVGRVNELAQLTDALAQAQSGRGSAWLIGGESGVGKSRLLDELRTQALVTGALVLHGQAVEGGGLPYQLWRQPLRRLALSGVLSDLEAAILKPIVPDIDLLLERDIADVPELPGAAGQQRLAMTILDLFRRQEQPVVFVVEDLQWGGESLHPLRRLIAAAEDLPLLIVGSHRSDERPQLIDELPGARPIALGRLSIAEIAELSAAMLGAAGRHPLIVERLSEETEGNTFFMVEVVRAMGEAAGRLENVSSSTLPRSFLAGEMQRLIQRRLERVPRWGQGLLAVAALAGRRLDLAVLAALAQAEPRLLEARPLDDWLRACADVAVLEIQNESWHFAHDKLREQLIAAQAPGDRPGRHRAIAEALERVYADDAARKPYHETLLAHWREAGDAERELDYLTLVVGNLTAIRADYRRAGALIERGLSLVGDRDPRRARLLNSQAESAWRRGDNPAAERLAQEALALATALAVPTEQVRSLNALGIIAERQGAYHDALGFYQQSLALSRQIDDAQSATRTMIGLGGLHYYLGQFATAEEYIHASLAAARALGDLPAIATALNNLGVIALDRGEYQAAGAYFQQSADHYREAGHREGAALTLNNSGDVAGALGDYATAERRFHESLAIYRAIDDQRGIAMVLGGLGNTLCATGDLQGAEQYLQQSADIYRAIGNTEGLSGALESLGRVAVDRGDVAAAEGYFEQSLTMARELGAALMIATTLDSRCAVALDAGLPRLLDELCEGLARSLELGARQLIRSLLSTAARRELSGGRAGEAAHLAGLLDARPASPEPENKRVALLLAELRGALSAELLAARMAAGAQGELEATAQAWLARLQAERDGAAS